MRNELQMIPTNSESGTRCDDVAAAQWRPRRDDSTKKAAIELDAALATRRALGAWAAVEIATESISEEAPRSRSSSLPRPNSSFLHGFLASQPHEGEDDPGGRSSPLADATPTRIEETKESAEGGGGSVASGDESGNGERETARKERGAEDNSSRRSPSPPLFRPAPSLFPSAPPPKKPSFRVVRRRDSRRKEARRHHAMAVLPGTKVATLASKFDALVLEKECSPARQKVAARVQRSLSAQKSAGAAPRRRRCDVEGRRQGWRGRRTEEGNSRRAEGVEGAERTSGSDRVRSAGTSVKDAIRMFEGNSRLGPPIPRKPKRSSSSEGKGGCEEGVGVAEGGDEGDRGEEGPGVAEGGNGCDEGCEADEKRRGEEEGRGAKEKLFEKRPEESAHEIGVPTVEEDEDGGYEPVRAGPQGQESAPAVRPNSSFLWGTIPRPSASFSPSLEEIVLLPGYASVQEEDCYDDVGPPSQRGQAEGAYESFAQGTAEKAGGYGEGEGSYDDVPSPEALAAADASSDCYESIYCGRGKGERAAAADEGGGSGEESRGEGSVAGSDSLSGIELKSNSLYGRCGSALSDGGGDLIRGVHEVLSYQLMGGIKCYESAERRSETSDEWVDVEASDEDSEAAVLVFCEQRLSRIGGRRSPKWSKKVRREWSSRSKKSGRVALDAENDQHHYETLYELVGEMVHREHQDTCTILVQEKPVLLNPSVERQHALPYENLSDDDDFDSFDSDATEECEVPTKELPCIPSEMSKVTSSLGAPLPGVNTNGITKKMAEVAGKKMQEFRKNWTMRKHDISRSLKRIRKKSGDELVFTGVPSHPQPPLPPTPDSAPALPPPRPCSVALIPHVAAPAVLTSAQPRHSVTQPPSNSPLNKSVSSGSLAGRKYWSFKSRFGRRESASTSSLLKQSSTSPSTSPSSSTFYLTETVNVDTGLTEKAPNITEAHVLERSSGNSLRWSVSEEDVIQKSVGEKQKSVKPPVNRRLSIRPQGPPPPPPPNNQNATHNNISHNGDARSSAAAASHLSCASTYAPLSSASSSSSSSSPYALNCNTSSPTTSWYIDTDVGLKRAGSLDESDNGQNADTSDSSSNVASPEGSLIHGQFIDEPLYQFYAASVAEKVTRNISQDSDSDGYEEIKESKSNKQHSPRPKAMDLVHHKEGCRTLWCQIPEVLASGLLDTFNSHQRKIQEAKFEVVTSEASYLKSLNILVTHFLESQIFNNETLLSKSDREILFSNVLPVKHCSEKFLADLEHCWQEDILLLDICDIIRRHAEKYFGVYVNYCSHQVHLDRALHRLKKFPLFLEAIASLESHPVCQSLSLHSFLMLPMQRVTRLPLLVDAILRRMPKDDPKYGACQVALATLNKVVQECNEGARQAERLEEMKVLSKQLDFREVRSPSLLSGGRWLVRRGELIHLHWRDDSSSTLLGVASSTAASSVSSISNAPAAPAASISTSKLTFGRKIMKQSLFLFLFTDLLVITKKKSEEHFLVLDFCPRNLVEIIAGGLDGIGAPSSLQQLPSKYLSEGGKNLFLLSMLQNHDNKTVEMVLSTSQESEKERWLEAFTPACSDNPDEQVYEEWDCPQVAAIHHYIAQQPDELSLEQSDIVNVLRKLSDGWYLGERIRDGEKGWFPANHCTEIVSSHVRAKNLRQRYRLLALSGDYLEQQRRERALVKVSKKKLKKESKKE